jgi:hypothetical protein
MNINRDGCGIQMKWKKTMMENGWEAVNFLRVYVIGAQLLTNVMRFEEESFVEISTVLKDLMTFEIEAIQLVP